MGNEVSGARFHRTSTAQKNTLLSKWQKRRLESQLFGVVRHAERADGLFAFYDAGRWSGSEDCHRWPLDPPLSDAGQLQADGLGEQIKDFAQRKGSEFHVVVTSPYLRCVQTAVRICQTLGPGVKLLVDLSLGEIYGPSVMGDVQPHGPVRSLDLAVQYCRSQGVECVGRAIGRAPVWPETLRDARRRFAHRFLSFLQRGGTARRNFLLVTHADCVGSVLGIMPDKKDFIADKVDYGATILGSRLTASGFQSEQSASSSSSIQAASSLPKTNFASILPFTSEMGLPEDILLSAMPSRHLNYLNTIQPARMDSVVEDPREEGFMNEDVDPGHLPTTTLQRREDLTAEKSRAQAMLNWKCETFNIELQKKSSKGTKFTKKIASLVQTGPRSQKEIERLLGEMGELPLSENEQTSSAVQRDNSTHNTIQSNLSLSTYLFGGSDNEGSNRDWGLSEGHSPLPGMSKTPSDASASHGSRSARAAPVSPFLLSPSDVSASHGSRSARAAPVSPFLLDLLEHCPGSPSSVTRSRTDLALGNRRRLSLTNSDALHGQLRRKSEATRARSVSMEASQLNAKATKQRDVEDSGDIPLAGSIITGEILPDSSSWAKHQQQSCQTKALWKIEVTHVSENDRAFEAGKHPSLPTTSSFPAPNETGVPVEVPKSMPYSSTSPPVSHPGPAVSNSLGTSSLLQRRRAGMKLPAINSEPEAKPVS